MWYQAFKCKKKLHIKNAVLKNDRGQARIDPDIPPKIDQNVKRANRTLRIIDE